MLPKIILILTVALVALIPRLSTTVVLGVDEASLWRTRSQDFLDALQSGELSESDVAYHPGVVTLWLGASGVALNRVVHGPNYYDIDPIGYFALMRLPIALFNAVGVALAFMLLNRLLNLPIALLAVGYWIFDPLIVAQSQIVHTDAPVMLLAFLTMLTALIATGVDVRHQIPPYRIVVRWRWWLLSGILMGLTVVAKLNGVLVVAAIGLFFLLQYRTYWRRPDWWFRFAGSMLLLAAIAALAFFLAFPAMWVEPVETFRSMFSRATDLTQEGHTQLFYGRVSEDPGLLFYVVTTAFRLTPLLTIGLLMAPFAVFSLRKSGLGSVFLALAIYIAVFFVITSVQPKKIDRYMLPIFPALYVFAAVGLFWFSSKIDRHLFTQRRRRTRMTFAVISSMLLVLVFITQITSSYPYMVAYYNPLLGGVRSASKVLTVGWGEGLEQAAQFVDRDSEGRCQFILTDYPNVMAEFTECPVLEARSCAYAQIAANPQDSYITLYLSYTQRGMNETIREAMRGIEPIHSVEIDGVEFASTYSAEDANIAVLREAGNRCNA